MKIADLPVRVVCDTGTARSLIRTTFASQLRRNKRTKEATYGPRPLNRPVQLEGVIKGRPSAVINEATQLSLDLTDAVQGNNARMEACFGEMSDLRTLSSWGSLSVPDSGTRPKRTMTVISGCISGSWE